MSADGFGSLRMCGAPCGVAHVVQGRFDLFIFEGRQHDGHTNAAVVGFEEPDVPGPLLTLANTFGVTLDQVLRHCPGEVIR